jgi:hypothetical protein
MDYSENNSDILSLKDMELDELVNKKNLRLIRDNYELLFNNGSLGDLVNVTDSYKRITDLKTIGTIINNLFVNKQTSNTVKYKYAKNKTEGRMFSCNVSLQTISRRIRGSLSKNIYYDIDMVNCHPVILKNFCKINNINTPHLDSYMTDRDPKLKEIMDDLKVTRDQAKTIPLSILNGGSGIIKPDDICTIAYDKKEEPSWISGLKKEVKKAYKCYILTDKGKKHLKSSKDQNRWNLIGSVLNNYFCEVENQLLVCLYKFLLKKSITVGAFVFDGLMINIESMKDTSLESLIEMMEHEMETNFGFQMNLSCKEFEYIDLKGLKKKSDEDVQKELDTHYRNKLLDPYYTLVEKAKDNIISPIKYIHEFPKLHEISNRETFSISNIESFINSICCNVCSGGKNSIFTISQEYDESTQTYKEVYTQNKYKTLSADGGFLNIIVRVINPNFEQEAHRYLDQQALIKTGVQFLTKDLIREPSLLINHSVTYGKTHQTIMGIMMLNNRLTTYRKAVFKPYLYPEEALVYKKDLNLFMGFPHFDALEDDSVSIDLYTNSTIFKNFKEKLCNGIAEPSSFDYIDNYFAHMIQKPCERPDSMVIISGAQGTGKDLFISFIEAMIGNDKVIQIDTMATLLKNFNVSIARKLLTKVNEISDKGVHIDKHDQLKEKITCKFLTIEPKGFDSYQLEHVSRYIGFSNKEKILTIENTDRRFMMVKTVNDMANNIPYHTQIKKEMDDLNMIRSAFKYYATKDISAYQPRIIPTTEYKAEQKIESLPYSLKFLFNLFEDVVKPGEIEYRKFAEDIYSDFLSWNIKMGNHKPVPRLCMIKDFERLGLVKQRLKLKSQQKTGFIITCVELTVLFKAYLNDPNLVLPSN